MKKYYFMVVLLVFTSFLLFGCDNVVEPTAEQFTITFNSNGGSEVTAITKNVNSSVAKPVDPTKKDYTFVKWYSDPSLTTEVTWPYTLSSDVTFYAKWEENVNTPTYIITWEVDGSIIETDSGVLEGTTPTYDGATPTKVSTAQYSYTFTGWSPTISTATQNQNYVAEFSQTIREYTISFNSNGGSTVQAVTDEYDTQLVEPAEPTKEGYHFVSWCLDSGLTQTVTWPLEITHNQTLYAKWNEAVPYGAYLSTLLSSYTQSPLSYIPNTMKMGSQLITEQQATIDYTSNTNLSTIPFGGFGEQWQMIVTNIEQSEAFFNVLTVVDTLSTISVTAFNNYLDTNPSNTALYQFTEGIYQVTISFEQGIMYYVLDYTTTVPIFGEQTVQIALSYDITTQDKVGRIQIGDANALRYEISDGSYKFAIRYLGVRRAYFEIVENDDESVEGRIFEYLGLDGSYSIGSAAEFFINDDYVSVVGNKSSSMMGWTGTINELYDVSNGRLLGYEVRETLSSITYNTLWFNLDDTSGITSIKFLEAPLEDSNPHLVYVNNSSTEFVTKNVGGFSTKTLSRRYDIELRTQYFYYQSGDDVVEVSLQIPMIFVQEEQLTTLVNDVNTSNPGLNFQFNVGTDIQDQIMSDYDMLIDAFIVQKDEHTAQTILDFIGTKYTHTS
ncbi:MAG: InlB B-repeat-containing protein [Acholeplasma sp.]|nr:InlB B-repeat-containing protein [Acholeplasma sp.]